MNRSECIEVKTHYGIVLRWHYQDHICLISLLLWSSFSCQILFWLTIACVLYAVLFHIWLGIILRVQFHCHCNGWPSTLSLDEVTLTSWRMENRPFPQPPRLASSRALSRMNLDGCWLRSRSGSCRPLGLLGTSLFSSVVRLRYDHRRSTVNSGQHWMRFHLCFALWSAGGMRCSDRQITVHFDLSKTEWEHVFRISGDVWWSVHVRSINRIIRSPKRLSKNQITYDRILYDRGRCGVLDLIVAEDLNECLTPGLLNWKVQFAEVCL